MNRNADRIRDISAGPLEPYRVETVPRWFRLGLAFAGLALIAILWS
jgi:hypothetical protein